MTKKEILQFPQTPGATSAGPASVQLFTQAPRLESITECVVFVRDGDVLVAQVFRESSSAKGTLSRDDYRYTAGGWVGPKECDHKFTRAQIPKGAYNTTLRAVDIQVHTLDAPLSPEDRTRLEQLFIFPGGSTEQK